MPAAAVIPAPQAYANAVAVKKLVVQCDIVLPAVVRKGFGFLSGVFSTRRCGCILHWLCPPFRICHLRTAAVLLLP